MPEAGSEPIFCLTIGTLLYQPKFVIDLLQQREKYHLRLKLLYNLLLNWNASLPMVVVLPTPFTPTTINVWLLSFELQILSLLLY
jgi:hypothetical protein